MTKKSILTIIIGLIAITLFSCKPPIIQPENVDSKIVNFVESYFPGTSIVSCTYEHQEYEVRLNDGTKIEFTKRKNWEEIDCEHSTLFTEVPSELIPEAISSFVMNNYPENKIIKIAKDDYGWEIELDNDIEIEFNKKFELLKID